MSKDQMETKIKTTGNETLDSQIQLWLKWDQNEDTRKQVLKYVRKGYVQRLHDLMLERMTFGTAGLRGIMEAGFNRMNDLVIIQTTQGLCKYMQKTFSEIKSMGVVIGFDARHNSHRFAQLAANVFLLESIPVYLFSSIVPTPFVPFSVVHYKAAAGIMVTASHNPKEDNGYKVYWDNGSQIVSPIDKGVEQSIKESMEPKEGVWHTDLPNDHILRKDPFDEISRVYFDNVKEQALNIEMNRNMKVRFTYTPMHGVGYEFMLRAFNYCGLPQFVPVLEQINPDPEFPTVKFPNPEEGKSALDLAMKTAGENNSTIILANDPDADRLAVAERQPEGSWKIFTGNELGALFGWWLWHCYKQKNPTADGKDVYMISSTVSSKILEAVARIENFNFVETLTGFKWMGNKAYELTKHGKTVLFAFEEAIGFMCGTMVLDKDGISAAMKIAEMIAHLETQGLTLTQQLRKVYELYGYHLIKSNYFVSYDQEKIKAMFDRLRSFETENNYPASLGKFNIVSVRDLTTGYDNSQPDCKAILPISSSSQMITFFFENGCVATLRTSGTEPKIKYYAELRAKPGQMNWEELEAELAQLEDLIVSEFFQPDSNNFSSRPST